MATGTLGATKEERIAAQAAVERAVADEAGRYFATVVQLERSGVIAGTVALRHSRHGGPAVVVETFNVSPLGLLRLMEVVDDSETGFAIDLADGHLRLVSSSWAPDDVGIGD